MEKYKRITYISVAILALLTLSYIFLKYLLGIFLPFAISFIIVALSRPIINKMCKRRRVPKKFASILVISVMLFLIIYLTVICISYGVKQLGTITNNILDNLSKEENFLSSAFDYIEGMKTKFPFLNKILPGMDESLYSILADTIGNGFKALSGKLTSVVAGFISSLPIFIIMVVVILLSLFYFSKDYDLISKKIESTMPKGVMSKLPIIKKDILGMTIKYIKAYAILLLITLVQLFSGFLILGINNSFILSILISFVDMLPVLGVGTVLIPWAIVELIMGNTFVGIGLIVLFIIIYIVRQFAEPKILSGQMNVHPLVTLFAMYAGLKILGIGGMIIAPLVAFIGKTVYNSIKKEKNVENQVKLWYYIKYIYLYYYFRRIIHYV